MHAAFCGGEGAVVEGGLLDEAPDLGKEDGPKEEHGDDRGDGLLAKDADTGIEQHAVGLGDKFDLQGGTHAEDSLEDAAFGDADVRTTRQEGVDAHIKPVHLEFATDGLYNLRYLDRRCLEKLFFTEYGHDNGKRLMVKFLEGVVVVDNREDASLGKETLDKLQVFLTETVFRLMQEGYHML